MSEGVPSEKLGGNAAPVNASDDGHPELHAPRPPHGPPLPLLLGVGGILRRRRGRKLEEDEERRQRKMDVGFECRGWRRVKRVDTNRISQEDEMVGLKGNQRQV